LYKVRCVVMEIAFDFIAFVLAYSGVYTDIKIIFGC
jgi:hypothetical protein